MGWVGIPLLAVAGCRGGSGHGMLAIRAGASGQRALARFVESEQTTRLPSAPTHERGAQTNSRTRPPTRGCVCVLCLGVYRVLG